MILTPADRPTDLDVSHGRSVRVGGIALVDDLLRDRTRLDVGLGRGPGEEWERSPTKTARDRYRGHRGSERACSTGTMRSPRMASRHGPLSRSDCIWSNAHTIWSVAASDSILAPRRVTEIPTCLSPGTVSLAACTIEPKSPGPSTVTSMRSPREERWRDGRLPALRTS